MSFILYYANATYCWVTPDAPGYYPASTNWGGNKFLHNLIRQDARGLARDTMVVYAQDVGSGGNYICAGNTAQQGIGRITKMQNYGTAWAGNVGGDPKLASESPDTYGTGWWYLRSGSACIDSGIAVVDSNGIAAEAVAPGYGWSNLTYGGVAPDIGAYEFNGENPSPLKTPVLSDFPTRKR
jgi:hypothetical protein